MAKSSINLERVNQDNLNHNDRSEFIEPDYLLPEKYRFGNEILNTAREAKQLIKNLLEEAGINFQEKFNQKLQAKSYLWEAVVNLNENHDMRDLQKLVKKLEKETGFTCVQISNHRDEGHLAKDQDGKEVAHYNYHAHLTFFTLDMKNGLQLYRKDISKPERRKLKAEVEAKYALEPELICEDFYVKRKWTKNSQRTNFRIRALIRERNFIIYNKERLSSLQTMVADELGMERGTVSVESEAKKLGVEVVQATARMGHKAFKQGKKNEGNSPILANKVVEINDLKKLYEQLLLHVKDYKDAEIQIEAMAENVIRDMKIDLELEKKVLQSELSKKVNELTEAENKSKGYLDDAKKQRNKKKQVRKLLKDEEVKTKDLQFDNEILTCSVKNKDDLILGYIKEKAKVTKEVESLKGLLEDAIDVNLLTQDKISALEQKIEKRIDNKKKTAKAIKKIIRESDHTCIKLEDQAYTWEYNDEGQHEAILWSDKYNEMVNRPLETSTEIKEVLNPLNVKMQEQINALGKNKKKTAKAIRKILRKNDNEIKKLNKWVEFTTLVFEKFANYFKIPMWGTLEEIDKMIDAKIEEMHPPFKKLEDTTRNLEKWREKEADGNVIENIDQFKAEGEALIVEVEELEDKVKKKLEPKELVEFLEVLVKENEMLLFGDKDGNGQLHSGRHFGYESKKHSSLKKELKFAKSTLRNKGLIGVDMNSFGAVDSPTMKKNSKGM